MTPLPESVVVGVDIPFRDVFVITAKFFAASVILGAVLGVIGGLLYYILLVP